MPHVKADEDCLRYVYILEVDNRGRKSKFFGHRTIFYVGQTNNLVRRFLEHLRGVNSAFLFHNFREARKKIVYVEQLFGSEYDAIGRELEIKRLKRPQKEALIRSEKNDLVVFVPFKVVILRRFGAPDEEVVLRL